VVTGDGEFRTADMSLSIGPAHPATHGVFRIVLEMDGERVREARPVIGYMHRGFEKLAEHRDYRQIKALVNRHDWLSGFSNELGVALAVEKLMEFEVPDRAQWIRMLLAEWNRILNHLMFIGSYALELGAITPMFYAFREREDIQHLLESATGGRLHFTYNQVGGLKIDLPKGFLAESAPVSSLVRSRLPDYFDLVLGNEIFHGRTKGVGPLPMEVALSIGVTGPTLQATGLPEDPRVTEPYLKYGEIDVEVPVGENGDAFDRFYCLLHRSGSRSTSSTRSTTTSPRGRSTPSCRRWSRPPRGRPTSARRTRSASSATGWSPTGDAPPGGSRCARRRSPTSRRSRT
jgi:NADH-quinone oxidoreductase subunit D